MEKEKAGATTEEIKDITKSKATINIEEEEVDETPTKRRRNMPVSIVWEHFERLKGDPNEPYARCKYCGATYACHSKRNGTGTMKNHLESCKKYPYQRKRDSSQKTLSFKPKEEAVRDSPSQLVCEPKEETVGDGPSQLGCESSNLQNCRETLAEMLIMEKLPFKFVESKGFKRFVSKLTCSQEPKFVIPSRFTIAKDILRIYVNEKQKLKDMFVKIKSKVCLTIDCWSSEPNINYMVLTAHFIDCDWKLHKKILSFTQIENHKGDTIGKTIEKILKDWGIKKVMTLTVDNARSDDTAIAFLIKRFNKRLICNGEYLHVRCYAQILNLIVCDAFKEHSESISRIRNAVRYVRSSLARLKKFKKCVENEKISCNSVMCLDDPTKWNSTYMMLESAIKFAKAFDRLEDDEDAYRNDSPPTKEDWGNARMLIRFLKVFYNVTLKVSGSLYTTSNLVFHEICRIQNCIQLNGNSGNKMLSTMAKNMKAKFDKYWGNDERKNNILLCIAVVLDPRYKMKCLKYCWNNLYGPDIAKAKMNMVENVLRRLFHEYNIGPLSDSSNSSSASCSTSVSVGVSASASACDFANEIHSCGCSFPNALDTIMDVDVDVDVENELEAEVELDYGITNSFKIDETTTFDKESEIDVYLLESLTPADSNFDILRWWKENDHRFEVLSRISRDILAIPVSTVASDSAFSIGGRVVNSNRCSLAPRMVEALICTQNWLNSDPINLELHNQDLEEDLKFEEGFRAVMDGEKDIKDMEDFV
ncbi:zinc finger BED domain-containing protein RICESLEEPER 2-like isoform X2 [Benincasa hispida]|uniref:zinc finger BED domain-containing protein RICESLEEPER 2-like isoform X2 n=1 Tax=Benincasa hispida TaxID=102211 RepID=UPI0019016EAB|nr:zinc finger BED domain-containing protein RICESLEEPER 2-like isoform X2 [Benincasa hispida]